MNYFADSEGTPECLACGMPTWSSANRSTCEYNCSLVLMENPAANTSRTYNLSPIGYVALNQQKLMSFKPIQHYLHW